MAAGQAFIFIAAAALLLVAAGYSDMHSADRLETVVIAGETFELEVVADDATRRQGLMHRQSIPEHGGMLFVYPSCQIQSYWMGYCLVDIDIIFLDARGRVTAMHEMKAEAPRREDESEIEYRERLRSYWSNYPSQFAIELKGGWLDRLDLHVEDKIELDLERLKALAR